MHKNKYYRAPKPSTLPQRHTSKPKPQWTTDFTDPDKYKLSEAEMIQRKAALQSKNREVGRQALEERRRKLQMGIVDEDTKKVYETALISKKIDLNPSVRRNLSQMIQYEREKNKEPQGKKVQNWEEEENVGFEQEIKKAGQFIKRLEKTKKQNNIEKALDILTADQKKSSKFGPTKQNMAEEENNNLSCEQTLSNIEETIKFMEMKLFNPKFGKCTEGEAEVKNEQLGMNKENKEINDHEQLSFNQFLAEKPEEGKQTSPLDAEMTNIKINLNLDKEQEGEQDDECLSTIRRMKQMIESKVDLYCPGPPKDKENFNSVNQDWVKAGMGLQKMNESDAEVDFSLTMNEEDHHFKIQQQKGQKSFSWERDRQYEEMKKSLFDQVDKLQNYSSNHQDQIKSPQQNQSNKFQEQSVVPQPMKKKKKKENASLNQQFQHIKNLIQGSKANVQKIQVEPIGITKGKKMMGFDYRGSINIKNNIVSQY